MYKKGDKVKIRDDLKALIYHSELTTNEDILNYAGRKGVVLGVYGCCYEIDIDNAKHVWIAEMFESTKPKLFKLL